MSGYLFFLSAVRDKVRNENPGSSVAKISQIAATMWKGMSQEEKNPYIEQSNQDKERYSKEKIL